MESETGKEIKLRPIGRAIGWATVVVLVFLFYESMAIEFRFFDEFSIVFMLFFIAIELTRLRILYEK